MKHPFLKTLLSFLIYGFCSCFSVSMAAVNPPAPTSGVDNLIGGYGVNQLDGTLTSLFFQTPDASYNQYLGQLMGSLVNPNLAGAVPATIKVDYTIGSNKFTYNSLDSFTSQDLNRMLTTTSPSLNTTAMSAIPGPLAITPQQLALMNLPYSQSGVTPTVSAASIDFNTLLLPLEYSDSSSIQNAMNFIQYASGLAQLPQTIDLSKLSPTDLKTVFQNNADFQQFIVGQRIISASQSVGLSNLYYLLAERIPQNNSNSNNNNSNNGVKTPSLSSPLKFENYLATRRFTDPNWIKGIQKIATPAELQRQNIYLLRDMLYVEYQRQMVDERLLAAISLMEINSNGMQQINLQQLNRKLQNQPPFGQPKTTPTAAQ
jgi:hypothetical protein